MSARIWRGAAWVLVAAALLAVGLLAWVYLGARMAASARSDPADVYQLYAAMALYAWVVIAKGLLPALLLTLAAWPVLDRVGRFAQRGPLGIALGLALAAGIASAVVTVWVLPRPVAGLPPLRSTGYGGAIRTGLEMAAAVALAAWLPRAVPPHWRGRAALAALGVVAALIGAGASANYWMPRRSEPTPTPEASDRVAAAPQPLAPQSELAVPPAAEPVTPTLPVPPPSPDSAVMEPSPEELESRRAIAARLRKILERAPTAHETAEVDGLLAEGDLHPVYENGELRGVGLENVQPDGFYAWIGLRDGDLVQSINGTPLGASGALFQQLIASPQVELSVERSDGSQQRISLTRQQIVEGLLQLE